MNFKLRRPCANCPFKAEGAIELRAGRLEGIVEDLRSDLTCFPCHKTARGEHVEDADGESHYEQTGLEQACIGALSYMEREGQIPVLARLAIRSGEITKEDIRAVRPVLKERP